MSDCPERLLLQGAFRGPMLLILGASAPPPHRSRAADPTTDGPIPHKYCAPFLVAASRKFERAIATLHPSIGPNTDILSIASLNASQRFRIASTAGGEPAFIGFSRLSSPATAADTCSLFSGSSAITASPTFTPS